MCGITGAFRVDGGGEPPLDAPTLERMTDVIVHRGPDDAGHVLEAGAALGARRLSIVDVGDGHQPMSNESGSIWGVQNGELYNHGAIRERLAHAGHRFRTRCDTEILPHLYEERGPALCEDLRGKFALAVWDGTNRSGMLARDRLGVKPLYYARVGDIVVFGSELKSVVASGLVSDRLDHEALACYLSLGFVPGALTPLADVRKLLPGERLVLEGGTARAERYWRYPEPAPETGARDAEDWAQLLLAELDEAVAVRLMSDVPLGAMLSGGLDSSIIVALMARRSSRPVKTFSVGFAQTRAGNELADARRVAAALGTEHHELELPLSGDRETLERLVWHMDEPVADLSALGFSALCAFAREHVTVALAGQGADELLGGYRKHRVASLVEAWRRVPPPLRGAAASAARRWAPADGRRLLDALDTSDPVTRLLASSGLLHGELNRELFGGALAEQRDAAERAARGLLHGSASAAPLDAALYLDAQLGLVDDMLHYFDRTSMASSLEVRVPFLDHHVVELCARIPASAKVSRLRTKHALRIAARGLVPPFVLKRPKLSFLRRSTGAWLAADGGAMVDELLLSERPRYGEVVDPAVVRRVVREWRGGMSGHSGAILSLVILELWLERFLPDAFGLAPDTGVGLDHLPRAA